jgi:protein-arginine kinase activator protein McsA
MASVFCDLCGERVATVFVTKIVNNASSKHRLCSECARESAGDALGNTLGDALPAALDGTLGAAFGPAGAGLPLEDIVQGILHNEALWPAEKEADEGEFQWEFSSGEFPADEDAVDDIDEEFEVLEAILKNSINPPQDSSPEGDFVEDDSNEWPADGEEFDPHAFDGNGFDDDAFSGLPPDNTSTPFQADDVDAAFLGQRCDKCGTTWHKLKNDGRAGCSRCYETFAAQLATVMERVQRTTQHAGKAPHAMERRQRRLLQLRAKRDHRLAMLQRRLQESVAEENYEEAAKLRDKIKMVSSTIVEQ